MITITKLPTFEGQLAGETAYCIVPKEKKQIYGFMLEVTAVDGSAAAIDGKTRVSEIRVKADGRTKFTVRPTIEDYMQGIDNISSDTYPTNFIPIFLAHQNGQGTPWGTADITKLEIEVDLLADTSSAIFKTVRGSIIYRALAKDIPRGAIIGQKFFTELPASDGWNEINDLPIDEFDGLQRIIFDSVYVEEVKISTADTVRRWSTQNELDALLKYGPYTKGAANKNRQAVVFDDLGSILEGLPLVGSDGQRLPLKVEYRWKTSQATAAFPIVIRGIENPR